MAFVPFKLSRPQKQTYSRNKNTENSKDFLKSLLSDDRKRRIDQDLQGSQPPPLAKRQEQSCLSPLAGSTSSLALSPSGSTPREKRKSFERSNKVHTRFGSNDKHKQKHNREYRGSPLHQKLRGKTNRNASNVFRQSPKSTKRDQKMRALAKIPLEELRDKPHSTVKPHAWQNFAKEQSRRHPTQCLVLRSKAENAPIPEKSVSLPPSSVGRAVSTLYSDKLLVLKSSVSMLNQRPSHASPVEQLPNEILLEILAMVFDFSESVRPYYQQGMLVEGVLCNPHDDRGVVHKENIDASVLRTNKRFKVLGSMVMYGLPQFVFKNPDMCRWWVHKIGPNFSLVRDLKLIVDSGWLTMPHGSFEDRQIFFDRCEEEKWHSVLNEITKIHDLCYLELTLIKWYKIEPEYRSQFSVPNYVPQKTRDRTKIVRWRLKLIDLVNRYFRGVKHCTVRDIVGIWLNYADTRKLAAAVCQPKETAYKRPCRSNVTFSEALADARRRGKTQTAITDEAIEELEKEAEALALTSH